MRMGALGICAHYAPPLPRRWPSLVRSITITLAITPIDGRIDLGGCRHGEEARALASLVLPLLDRGALKCLSS